MIGYPWFAELTNSTFALRGAALAAPEYPARVIIERRARFPSAWLARPRGLRLPGTQAGKTQGMHVLRRGSGKPILLIHGLGSDGNSWEPVLPRLVEQREVIAPDLPGFGQTPPMSGQVTIAGLTDTVESFIAEQQLGDVDLVGSSMGARMALELARRGHGGAVVALDPGGFWTPGEARALHASLGASIRLVRLLRPVLPKITGNMAVRAALLAQFSAKPWALPQEWVLPELLRFATAADFDRTLRALASDPPQQGMPHGHARKPIVIGWGAQDRVTFPNQARRAAQRFPDARVHWFHRCGHFPVWDRPDATADLILETTG